MRGWKNMAACFGGWECRLLLGGSVLPALSMGGMSGLPGAEQPCPEPGSRRWDGLDVGIARELLRLVHAEGCEGSSPPCQRRTTSFCSLGAANRGSVPTRWACLDSDGILSRKHTAGGWGHRGEETSNAPRFSLRAQEAVNGRGVGELSSSQDWGQRNSHCSSLPKL